MLRRTGLGISLVSRAAVARELADGTLEEWRAGPLPLRRQWHLVVRLNEDLPATAALLRNHVLSSKQQAWNNPAEPSAAFAPVLPQDFPDNGEAADRAAS